MLWTGCHCWHATARHVLRSYSIILLSKSIDPSGTIIFPMYHQQLGAAGSNRYSWIRWSCPHATCQKVTNNRVAAHYSLTSLRSWQLAFIHIYAPLSSACFFPPVEHRPSGGKEKYSVCRTCGLITGKKTNNNYYYEIVDIFAFIFQCL